VAALAWAAAAVFAAVLLARGQDAAGRAMLAQTARRTDVAVAALYRARGERPIWFAAPASSRAAHQFIAMLERSGEDDLSPAAYGPDRLKALVHAAEKGNRQAVARADVALTAALARYVVDLHRPPPAAASLYADRAVMPAEADEGAQLAALGRARSVEAYLAAATRMNPIYRDLRAALAVEGAGQLAPLIRLNMERARGLPTDLGKRFIVVNAPAERLWYYDADRPVGTMRVVVGKPSEPTPMLNGVIRYAIFNPYWNIPPDLVRERVAPKVLRRGDAALRDQHLQILSDWSPSARVLRPQAVDWKAVAADRQTLRVRQLPGTDNMMGTVKFIFPNSLGVYLHDTPNKAAFGEAGRTLSAGCVRLQHAALVTHWLFGKDRPQGDARDPEHRVNLPSPAPVYIVYLTVARSSDGLVRLPDIYGRDAPLLRQLRAAGRLTDADVAAAAGVGAHAPSARQATPLGDPPPS
jgi:murein L,D-transpeptidase YcbB/YkuD